MANKQNNRSRTGACRCVEGYARNSNTSICEPRKVTVPDALVISGQPAAFMVKIQGPSVVQLPVEDVNLTAVVSWRKEQKENVSEGKGRGLYRWVGRALVDERSTQRGWRRRFGESEDLQGSRYKATFTHFSRKNGLFVDDQIISAE